MSCEYTDIASTLIPLAAPVRSFALKAGAPVAVFLAKAVAIGFLITAGTTDLPSFPALAITPIFPTGTAAIVPKCVSPLKAPPHHVLVSIGFSSFTNQSSHSALYPPSSLDSLPISPVAKSIILSGKVIKEEAVSCSPPPRAAKISLVYSPIPQFSLFLVSSISFFLCSVSFSLICCC